MLRKWTDIKNLKIDAVSQSSQRTMFRAQFTIPSRLVATLEDSRSWPLRMSAAPWRGNPKKQLQPIEEEAIQEEALYRQPTREKNTLHSNRELEENLFGRNKNQPDRENRSVSERRGTEERTEEENRGPTPRYPEVFLRRSNLHTWNASNRVLSENRSLPDDNATFSPILVGKNSMARKSSFKSSATDRTNLAIVTFNCQSWKSIIMRNLIRDLSDHHTKDIVIGCQETWKFQFPKSFVKEFSDRYCFIHESAMDPNTPRGKGRPFGGIGFIISKSIAYRINYRSSRCISIVLTDFNLLLNNVYLASQDSRVSAAVNLENMSESLGHLDAAHTLCTEITERVTIGDFNITPDDLSNRSEAVARQLNLHQYEDTDLRFMSRGEYSHNSGRLIDRFFYDIPADLSVRLKIVCYAYVSKVRSLPRGC